MWTTVASSWSSWISWAASPSPIADDGASLAAATSASTVDRAVGASSEANAHTILDAHRVRTAPNPSRLPGGPTVQVTSRASRLSRPTSPTPHSSYALLGNPNNTCWSSRG
jgi:hypothetical protein